MLATLDSNNGAVPSLDVVATERISSSLGELASRDTTLEEDIHFSKSLALGLTIVQSQ